ncbi:MAG: hypothetical protein H7Y30_16915, partial [Pyrinomonadaceae bacterium]|nr:hypothetical protein [Pyrinomonadaceae bacterium]
MTILGRVRPGTDLPRSLAVLARMGKELDHRWAERGYRLRSFPKLAAEALRATSYHQQFDEDEV